MADATNKSAPKSAPGIPGRGTPFASGPGAAASSIPVPVAGTSTAPTAVKASTLSPKGGVGSAPSIPELSAAVSRYQQPRMDLFLLLHDGHDPRLLASLYRTGRMTDAQWQRFVRSLRLAAAEVLGIPLIDLFLTEVRS